VLLASEELGELLEFADRIMVVFVGRFVHQTPAATPTLPRYGATWRDIDRPISERNISSRPRETDVINGFTFMA
jgi:hypothetical protein